MHIKSNHVSSTHEESSIADRHPWSAGRARPLMSMRCNTQLRGVTSQCGTAQGHILPQAHSLVCCSVQTVLHYFLHPLFFMAPTSPCLLLFCPTSPPSPAALRLGQRVPSSRKCAFRYLTTYIKSSVITKRLRIHLVKTDFASANPSPKYFQTYLRLQLIP